MAIAFDYISWLNTEREINVRTEGLVVRWAEHCTEPATSDEACFSARAHSTMSPGHSYRHTGWEGQARHSGAMVQELSQLI